MTSIGLFFAGSVLFINGVSLLGCCDAAEAAPVNAFVGVLLMAVVASICIPVSDLSHNAMFSAVGFLVFAFTYLGVAINNWTGGSGAALGWYCLWAVAASLFLAGVNFTRYHNPQFGTLWLLWAVLFTLFFLVLALGVRQLEWATGWAATIEAVITTTIPGGLMLLGYWRSVPGSVAIGTGGITIVLIGALAIWSSGRSARRSVSGEPTVAPTLAGAPHAGQA